MRFLNVAPRGTPRARIGWWSTSLIGAAVLVATPAMAQTLSGAVVSPAGEPVPDVVVTLARRVDGRTGGVAQRTATDGSGRFSFTIAIDGDYLLRAERLGYVSFTSEPVTLVSDDSVAVRLTLDVEPLLLEPLEVTASSRPWWEVLQAPTLWPFFERMERYQAEGRGRFFTQREIQMWRGVPLAQALSGALPYLRTELARGRSGQYVLRGPGRCEPIVFVNGSFVDLAPKGPNGRVIEYVPIDLIANVHSLVAVEAYRGMSQAPAELQSLRRGLNLNCTVIGLWTLRR